jgi:predicted metal-dependent hydrolase
MKDSAEMKRPTAYELRIGELSVRVHRKDIKNLHLSVRPPDGSVRISVPRSHLDDEIKSFIAEKLPWIERKRAFFADRSRPAPLEFTEGEVHAFLGSPCALRLIERAGSPRAILRDGTGIEIRAAGNSTKSEREASVFSLYRRELSNVIPPMLRRWEKALAVSAAFWGLKRMKTKWGSCNITAKRIWINIELAKKPVECLEFVVLHELCHLRVRNHGPRFVALMDGHMADWRERMATLNAAPIER